MKNKGTKKHPVRWILLALLVAALICGSLYSYFGGFNKVKPIDTEEFAKYAKNVLDITIPDSVRIVALGEATHGNAEFQQLKLDVFTPRQ